MIDKSTSQTLVTKLTARHPSLADQPQKVEDKVASLSRGLGWLLFGGALLLLAVVIFGGVVYLFRDRELGLSFAAMALIMPGLIGLVGIRFIFVGGSISSGEAWEVAAEDTKGLVGLVARAVAKARKTT